MHSHRPFVLSISAFLMLGLLLISGCSSGASPGQAAPSGGGSSMGANAAPTSTMPDRTQPAAIPTTPAAAAAVSPVETGTVTQPSEEVPSTGQASGIPTDTVTTIPDGAGYTWKLIVDGLNKPLDMATPTDGSGRILILEQAGTIRVAQNGALLPGVFLDITDRVGSRESEQGLLGIALHPDFGSNGFFYINYTDKNGDTVIARYSVTKEDPNRADPNSEKVLLQVDQPYANHNGGSMVFGPDGYLYMGLGDGGSGGDPHGNGQSHDTLLGKLLRVDVNNGDPYAIPQDNPFAKGGGKAEIWAYGLRNPWRFSFDRLTKDLYIADVGQDQWEEVDFLAGNQPGGANFGWNYREGKHPFRGQPPADATID